MKFIKRMFAFVFLIIILFCSMLVYAGYSKYKNAMNELPIATAVLQIKNIDNFTAIDDVPEIYKKALIATEDRRFYIHNGFDVIGTVRALTKDIKEKKLLEGGSTITQQLAKNIYFPVDKSPVRKLAEIFMAVKFEKIYTKDEILELYINAIYYGSGYYNIHDAAVGYFKKPPSEMSDYEATLLAGVPNAPSVYSPKVNPELCEIRRKKVIKNMLSCGYITDDEAQLLYDTNE